MVKTLKLRLFRVQDSKQADLKSASLRLELLQANGYEECYKGFNIFCSQMLLKIIFDCNFLCHF